MRVSQSAAFVASLALMPASTADDGAAVPADLREQPLAVGGHRRELLLRPVEHLARVACPARHARGQVGQGVVPRRVVVTDCRGPHHEQVDVAGGVAVTARSGAVDDDGGGWVGPGAGVLGDPRPELLPQRR